jgi:Kef-type K+ transport system membrane component KefB
MIDDGAAHRGASDYRPPVGRFRRMMISTLLMRKRVSVYVLTLVILGTATLLMLRAGTSLNTSRLRSQNAADAGAPAGDARTRGRNAISAQADIASKQPKDSRHPLSILLLQVIAILLSARIVGALLRKAGQPSVIGEMIVGILLGPSLLGVLWPSAMTFLFPPQSLDALGLLSQVGLVIFMFVVGMELDVEHLLGKGHAVLLVSHVSILVPFLLGTVFSLIIYSYAAPPNINFTAFALFISVAMSITAFPVLARILKERNMSSSSLGNTALACAAVNDVTAWCLLTVVIAISKASGLGGAVWVIFLTIIFTGLMLFVVKGQLKRIAHSYSKDALGHNSLVTVVLIFTFVCALCTEVIGIHALFGAFLAGVVMPARAGMRKFLTERVGVFATGFLLPLFFAFTGLRTQIGLLNDWTSWLMCAGVIVLAVAGKLGGSMLAARWTEMNWRDSFSLGALMNTRGLIELIVLNIGYDLGILSPRIFSMMVCMALVTTCMASPLIGWVGRKSKSSSFELVPVR